MGIGGLDASRTKVPAGINNLREENEDEKDDHLRNGSFFVLSSSTFVLAKDESAGDLSTPEVVGDLLWVRPLGTMNVGLGAICYVISLPVTIPLRKATETKEFLVTYPYYYYFKRPLREM